MRPKRPVPQRFWSKVERRDGGCWEWRGCRSRGYGYFAGEGGQVLAHRWSYEYLRGPIPPGLTLDHLCRNRACVNPAHLEIVTRGENVLRGVGISAENARKDGCRRGHLFTVDSFYLWIDKRGGTHRICKQCTAERGRASKAARKTMPHSRDRTHCPQGHPYAGANLYTAPDGRRTCKTCEKAKFRRWRERHPDYYRDRAAKRRSVSEVN